MNSSTLFILISGIWGLAMVVNFVDAIRLHQAIGQRSGLDSKTGLAAYMEMWGVARNRSVAQDEETQELRRQMNRRLLIILGGFIFFAAYLYLTRGAA